MLDFLTHLFDTSGFPARWDCGLWTPGHGWLHILSDLAIWSAYFAIPCILAYFVLHRRDIPFRMIFWLFGAFILACGTTHLMEAIIFWQPVYRLASVIKLFTAIVSWGTVFALIPVVPMALAMRSPEELEREIAARKQAEEKLHLANADLERRVEERTMELTLAVAELRTERELLQTTLGSIGDGVVATDNEGQVTFLNPVAETLTGWADTDAKGMLLGKVFNIVNEQTRQAVENPVLRSLQEGIIVGLANHTILIAKDGTERLVDDSAAPIRGKSGVVVGAVLVFRDTTERRLVEQADRKNKEVLKLVHKIGKIGHWEWNSLTDENKWSPEIEALYGLLPGGFKGGYENWTKLLHPDDLAKAEADVRRAFETGEYFTEFRVIWPDGSVHWIETRANVFKDDQAKPVRMVGVNMDVTERKKIEEELRHSQKELQQRIEQLAEADRRKNEFLATLAHELRNPLAPIINALELIKSADGNDVLIEQARSLLDRQVGHMIRLVDDLFDLGRISRGRVELRKERVELSEAVQSAVEASRPLIEAQTHELTITLPEKPIYVEADPTRLAEVLQNLLSNAAKYTEKGGHIWLTVEREGGDVVMSVKDTGIGIAAEHLPQIFEMFSQVTPALGRSQGGLGIGLALVRGLVELHGGTTVAHSEGIGKGSEFIVRLPIVDVSVQKEPQNRAKDRTAPIIHKYRILVVDDNKDTANTLAKMLQITGHDTRPAYDGLEAIQVAETFRPDVILLDLGLPNLNGYETARRIREQPWGKNMVLIALTGWGQEEDRQRSREAGFDHHLVKPIKAATLNELLAELKPMP